MFDVQKIREDFPILSRTFFGKPLTYLDNSATTQKPSAVIEAMNNYYRNSNANVHRGIYALSDEATNAYEDARDKVARFINAPSRESVIFTSGTTDSINLVANILSCDRIRTGDEILLTHMEHHSNLVPWQIVAQKTGAVLRFIPLTEDGHLDREELHRLVSEKTKIISIIHISNVLGTINPIEEIIKLGHAYNALVVVDGAQSVPHVQVDVQKLDVDFLAFSAHKMLGPTGCGVLYGKQNLLRELPPWRGGGDMISEVQFEFSTYKDIPYKFEAGTPNISGAIGLGVAIDYLSTIGFDEIQKYENELVEYAVSKLEMIPGVTIYGPRHHRGDLISFNVQGIHPHDVSTILDQDAIAVRAGHHCAQPLMRLLNIPATVRASFYFYNVKEEIDRLAESIRKVKEVFAGVA